MHLPRTILYLLILSLQFQCLAQELNDKSMADYKAKGIISTLDVDYISESDYEDNKDKLDIFGPEGKGYLPVLIFFHGGALMEGDKSMETKIPEVFVKEGMVVVVSNYRLSPKVMHPAHINDAAKCFAWVKNNIAKYGGDPERIYLSGHSAGAYLAVLLSMDPSYLAVHHLSLDEIAGTIGVSPFLFVEETAKERDKSVWGTNERDWLSASVRPYIGPGKPPILLLYADGDDDWRKSHNQELARLLISSGNPTVQVVEVTNRDHGSIWNNIDLPSDMVSKLMIDFIIAQ